MANSLLTNGHASNQQEKHETQTDYNWSQKRSHQPNSSEQSISLLPQAILQERGKFLFYACFNSLGINGG